MERKSGYREEKVVTAILIVACALAAACVAMLSVSIAYSAPNGGTIWFTVPGKVSEIRVRSYKDGKLVMDRSLDVVPGQTFRIDPQ